MFSIPQSSKCPVCLDSLSLPTIYCSKGHGICSQCVEANTLINCPVCFTPLQVNPLYSFGVSNLQMKQPCTNMSMGCASILKADEVEAHEEVCNYRRIWCNGQKSCTWSGAYGELLQHFKIFHPSQSIMGWVAGGPIQLPINFSTSHTDVHILSTEGMPELFWYTHKVDVDKQKLYWTFQYIGSKEEAKNFVYEFEVFNTPTGKFKVEEHCQNNLRNVDDIFQSEECVVMSFQTAKKYFNNKNEITFRYKIKRFTMD